MPGLSRLRNGVPLRRPVRPPSRGDARDDAGEARLAIRRPRRSLGLRSTFATHDGNGHVAPAPRHANPDLVLESAWTLRVCNGNARVDGEVRSARFLRCSRRWLPRPGRVIARLRHGRPAHRDKSCYRAYPYGEWLLDGRRGRPEVLRSFACTR